MLLGGIAVAAIGYGGTYNNTFALPGVQSPTAENLLTALAGKPTDTTSVQVVWSPASGSVTDPATKEAIDPTLKEIAALPFVQCVVGPYGENLGTTCPKATPTDLKAAVEAAIRAELAKKTGIPEDRLGEAAALLQEIEPLKDADPARLAALGRALPEIARLASAPKADLEALAAITPKDLQFLVGLSAADVTAALDALGGLDRFANLPPATLTALATADKADLAAFAKALPADVAGLEKVMAGIASAAAADPALAKDIAAVAKATGLGAGASGRDAPERDRAAGEGGSGEAGRRGPRAAVPGLDGVGRQGEPRCPGEAHPQGPVLPRRPHEGRHRPR